MKASNLCIVSVLAALSAASTVQADVRVERLYEQMDASRDDFVSLQEYQDYWQGRFHRRDKDKNGVLNGGELASGPLEAQDGNGDDVVSWEEALEVRQRLFEQMDQNQDQLLTLSEMLAPAESRVSTTDSDAVPAKPVDYAAQRATVAALSSLTTAPQMWLAEGFDSTDDLAAIYFDALDWQGEPTKVFAWLGLPEDRDAKVPAIVLVHGGGGTAFKDWVKLWNARGYVAISIAVEGQTSRQEGKAWASHEWAGPSRQGIYHDSSEPLTDQWMYHAVADTILANSLLRSLPEVDAEQVGIMGISWGGVITSTVMGLDDRFAFAIPTYGCGDLKSAENQYGKSLGDNQSYQQVWDPILRLKQAQMPTLWYSWPADQHFPLDKQAACYAETPPKTHMVSLVPNMGHSHNAAWDRPESYAFADSVTREGEMWCRQVKSSLRKNIFRVTFRSIKPLDAAVLVSTVDDGVMGDRKWVEKPLGSLEERGNNLTVKAKIPEGSTAWFVNVKSGDLIASSDFFEAE
ncbi:acetylxylan esterase [Coraliomargarita sp. W4R72]